MIRLYHISQKFLFAILFGITCILILLSMRDLILTSNVCKWAGLTTSILGIIGFIVFTKHIDVFKIKHYTLVLFISGTLLRLLVIALIHPPIESDFLRMYEAAISIVQGDLSFSDSAYFSLWAYQGIFVAWEAMFLKLWSNPLILKIVNALLASASICLIYRLMRETMKEKAAQMTSVIMNVFPFFITFPAILSNQLPSAFFLCLSIWVLMSCDIRWLGYSRYFIAGILLQLGNLLRPEGILILASIIGAFILWVLKNPARIKKILCGLLLLFVAYAGSFQIADSIVKCSELNPNGLQNGNPMWKFVTGLNYDTMGGYSNEDWAVIYPTLDENNQITEKTKNIQKALISERLHQPFTKTIKHLIHKVSFFWCSDALVWPLGYLQDAGYRDLYMFLKGIDRGVFLCVLCFMGSGMLMHQRKNELVPIRFPYFMMLVSFSVFLLIEVQSRYAYLPLLFLFWCSSYGLQKFVVEESKIQSDLEGNS